jgi:hypothetical protein
MAKQKETFISRSFITSYRCLCKGRNGYRKNKRYLYSILVIADDFAPEANLKETAQKLLPEATA